MHDEGDSGCGDLEKEVLTGDGDCTEVVKRSSPPSSCGVSTARCPSGTKLGHTNSLSERRRTLSGASGRGGSSGRLDRLVLVIEIRHRTKFSKANSRLTDVPTIEVK